MRSLRLCVLAVSLGFSAWGIPPNEKTLPIGLAPEERGLPLSRQSATEPPPGEVRSLAEWELSDAVMTLWDNASLLKALSDHGKVKLLADTESDVGYWKNRLKNYGIAEDNFSYYVVPTDSIWVRDYGPWFILDGNRKFGVVDTNYNRPRPQDDLVPQFIAETLKVPFFHTGLTHTGGNYYNDGMQNAFSSTLVYKENSGLSADKVNDRMKRFLGVSRYTTSPLGERVTIEHLDTFGKLVSPDTWVFSDFPAGSRFKADADNMVAKLQTMKSAYGTPYKIHRLKMQTFGREEYRAYINAFISNGALYYPQYGKGDAGDKYAAEVYQKALPGYEIVGVDAGGTSWGDSVHCRNRNLLKRDTLFIFPELTSTGEKGHGPFTITAEVIPVEGTPLAEAPLVYASWNGSALTPVAMTATEKARYYQATLPEQAGSGTLSFYLLAKDSAGRSRIAPTKAPLQQIELTVP